MAVDIHVDGSEGVPDQGTQYLHCGRCLDEWKESFEGTCSPKDYARQQVALTKTGIQVWCTRHDVNVALFEFAETKTNLNRIRRAITLGNLKGTT